MTPPRTAPQDPAESPEIAGADEGPPTTPEAPKDAAVEDGAQQRRRLRTVLWLTLPTVILLPLVLASTYWRLPTRVQLEVTTRRVAFTVGGVEMREVLNAGVEFSSLLVADCREVALSPRRLAVEDPMPATESSQRSPEPAWRELELAGRVRLRCRYEDSKVRLVSPESTVEILGTLDRIWAAPGSRVLLAVTSGRGLDVVVQVDTPQSLAIPVYGEVRIVTDGVDLEGIAAPSSAGDLKTYRATFAAPDRMLEVESSDRGCTLVFTPAPGRSIGDVFTRQPIPLAGLDLLEERLGGGVATPLLAAGQLSYPELPAIAAVAVARDELVGLGALEKFRLRGIELDAEAPGLKLRLDGIAGKVRTAAGEFRADHRLTVFHHFRYSWRWTLLAVVAVWAVATTRGARELWKGLSP